MSWGNALGTYELIVLFTQILPGLPKLESIRLGQYNKYMVPNWDVIGDAVVKKWKNSTARLTEIDAPQSACTLHADFGDDKEACEGILKVYETFKFLYGFPVDGASCTNEIEQCMRANKARSSEDVQQIISGTNNKKRLPQSVWPLFLERGNSASAIFSSFEEERDSTTLYCLLREGPILSLVCANDDDDGSKQQEKHIKCRRLK
jgi:hypothetical protein